MKKTILITGSTDGIGKLTAIKLAKNGHNVYLHGRSPEKLNVAITEVKELTNNKNIGGFLADLSYLNAVKEMAKQINSELPKLDVLINNAGVFKSPNPLNKEGIDMRMVVNYLAPVLLTRELLPLLEKGTKSRVVNLSSAAQAPVSLSLLCGNEERSEQETYAQSKLALTMWSFDLAKKLNNISVMAVNPGSLLNTKMVQEAYGQYWSTADKGANILYDLAVAEEYESITGKYYDNDHHQIGEAHADAYNSKKIEELLTLTHKILS